jgi:lysine 2,3-aminomutase
MEDLMRALVSCRIKPYYLHHPDLVPGTAHFRPGIDEGQALMRGLRGRISGLCQPTYVLDIPDGYGKVPVGPNYVGPSHLAKNGESYEVLDWQGHAHPYPPA